MNRQLTNIILRLSLILTLGFILMPSAACFTFTTDMIIENQTEDVLTISISDYSVGEVEPGAQITQEVITDSRDYLIVAKNAEGEIVYSKKHHSWELDEEDYKVVITYSPE